MKSLVDLVWSTMKEGELYSPEDIATCSRQSKDDVSRVLGFLARYGFAEQLVKREPLFRKVRDVPGPSDALAVLQKITVDESIRDIESLTKVRKR